MTISNAISLCVKNGVKVYPVKGKVCVSKTGQDIVVYSKMPDDLNLALEKTYFAEAKKLIMR